MAFIYYFFLAFILPSLLVAGEQDYLDDYFDQVVANFNQKILDAGLSSLGFNDATMMVNRSLGGVPMVGKVAFSNIILMDVATLETLKEGHRGYPEDDGVHLFYQILFPNLTLFSNAAADLQPPGVEKGTAELLFFNTSIAVYLDKNYTIGETSVHTSTYATMAPATNFLPVSDVMDAAARLSRLDFSNQILWDQVNIWCNKTFTAMLSNIILNEVEFPMFPPDGDDI